ncbi:ATP-dependent RNA helicase HAS1, partial [Trichinella pseudospiralis]
LNSCRKMAIPISSLFNVYVWQMKCSCRKKQARIMRILKIYAGDFQMTVVLVGGMKANRISIVDLWWNFPVVINSPGNSESCGMPQIVVKFRNVDVRSDDDSAKKSDSEEMTCSWNDVPELSNEIDENVFYCMTVNNIYFRNGGLLQTFLSYCFHSQLMKGLRSMDCRILTKAQSCIVPAICAGKNAVFHFPKGSGRLVGFLTPILNWILNQKNAKGQRSNEMNPQAVIVAPSINVASAIFHCCLDLAICTDLVIRCAMSSVCWKLLGSHPELGCDVLIGTPEGLHKFRNRNCSFMDNCRFLVVMQAPDIFFAFKNQMTALLCDFPKDNTNVFFFSAKYTDLLHSFYRKKIDSDLVFLPSQAE